MQPRAQSVASAVLQHGARDYAAELSDAMDTVAMKPCVEWVSKWNWTMNCTFSLLFHMVPFAMHGSTFVSSP